MVPAVEFPSRPVLTEMCGLAIGSAVSVLMPRGERSQIAAGCDATPFNGRSEATTCTPFQCKDAIPNHCRGAIMPTVKLRASTILAEFELAHAELVGKAVILTDGKAGTVEHVWLDEWHGLRISIRGHEGKWPVSTVKFSQVS
jgi:hypothetical protein